ncbi:MAG: NAD(P)H-dependent oxidoreductase, partial [Desulfovibrionaceae bacterium]|nr:NAD(P)H-dependent oxidoreductase [Desulfovibrionaceae bacterium]
MSKKVLLVCGHTDLAGNSVATKTIVGELAKKHPEIELDLLADLYPDYKIDVAAEQAKLVAADVIILQYPLFWFGTPS